MARGKSRKTDGPPPLRCAAQAQAHPAAVSGGERGAHAGVRSGGGRQRQTLHGAMWCASSITSAHWGATEEIEEYRVELEDMAALELAIIPNLSGGSYASVAQLRLA